MSEASQDRVFVNWAIIGLIVAAMVINAAIFAMREASYDNCLEFNKEARDSWFVQEKDCGEKPE